MRWLSGTLIVAVTLGLAAPACRAADGPSIEEMFEVIAQKLASGGSTAATSPRPARPGKKGEVERYEPTSEKIGEVKGKINQKTSERIAGYVKFKQYWPQAMLYMDIQKFDLAGNILLGRFIPDRIPKRQRGPLVSGEAHREAAYVLAMAGKAEQAEAFATEAASRAAHPHHQNSADWAMKFVDKYPEAKKQCDELEAKYAASPGDAKLCWSLVNMYRTNVRQRLDELFNLMDMLDRFPTHSMVKSGEVEWRIAEGYGRYHLSDEATVLYVKIAKDYPKHGQVKSGECWWRAGEGLRRQKKWKQARDYYQRMLKETPKHHHCRLQQNQTETTVARRIKECNQYLR